MDSTGLLIAVVVGATCVIIGAIVLLSRKQQELPYETLKRLQDDAYAQAQKKTEDERIILEEKFKAMAADMVRVNSETKSALENQKELFDEKIKSVEDKMSSIKSEIVTVSESTKEVIAKGSEAQANRIDETIKTQVDTLTRTVNDMNALVKDLENKRQQQSDSAVTEVTTLKNEIARVLSVSTSLSDALKNNGARGKFGEKIAEDVIRACGLVEGVSYRKQETQSGNERNSRPDYTFVMPDQRILNMDVKFPLDQYERYLGSNDNKDAEKFITTVKSHVRSVASKQYIDTQNKTLDYAIVFIPNEGVYQFILEYDFKRQLGLFDEAMNLRIILCSPLNLFAVLKTIHQAHVYYQSDKNRDEILKLLNRFKKQWEEYTGAVEDTRKKFSLAQKEFDSLATTRVNQLQKVFVDIETLSKSKPEGPLESNSGMTAGQPEELPSPSSDMLIQ